MVLQASYTYLCNEYIHLAGAGLIPLACQVPNRWRNLSLGFGSPTRGVWKVPEAITAGTYLAAVSKAVER